MSFVYPGIDLDSIDEQVAQAEAEEAVAFDPTSVEEPWISTDEMVAYGKKQAQANCAACHGVDGLGNNGVARNFVEGQWKQGGKTIELYKTVASGVPGTSMIAFKHIGSVDRWAIVHWIRSITENKPEDDASELSQFGSSAK